MRVFLVLVSSALLLPSLWLVPPLSILDKKRGNGDSSFKVNVQNKSTGTSVGADVFPSCTDLFLQKCGFLHSLSSFFLRSPLLLILPPLLLLYEALSLGLLSCSLLCPPALQFFTTPPGNIKYKKYSLPQCAAFLSRGDACYLSASSLCRRSCSSLSRCSRASLLFSARRREASSGSVVPAEGLNMTSGGCGAERGGVWGGPERKNFIMYLKH